MSEPVVAPKSEGIRKSSWWLPGVVMTSLAGAAAMVFRGCWHSNMSWPLNVNGFSYQVCLNCGAMRLFDEKNLKAYGPVRYNLAALIAWERSAKAARHSV